MTLSGAQAYAKAGIKASPVALSSREDGDEIVLDLFDVIGSDMFGEGITAKSVTEALAGSTAKTVKVRLNSPGGHAFEGIAIRSLLRAHAEEAGAQIVAEVHGLAASAATLIAMAADQIHIAEDAMFMVHESHGIAMGEADDMRHVASVLDRVNDVMAAAYVKRTGKTDAEVRELMAAETWMTGAEAVTEGFADAVLGADDGAEAFVNERVFAALTKFEHVPGDLLARYRSESGDLLVAAMAGTRPQPKAPEAKPTEPDMKITQIAAALGMDASVTESDVLTQIETLREGFESVTAERDTIAAEHDKVCAKLGEATQKLEAIEAEAKAKAVDAALTEALKAKKITPAEEPGYRELAESNLDLFSKLMAARPSALQDSELADRKAPTNFEINGRTLADLTKAAKDLGVTVESYVKHNPEFAPLLEGAKAE